MEGVWRLPALPTAAFVGIDWWLWEPPSLYKSVFASQVFVQSSADFLYKSVTPSGAKSQGCINVGNNTAVIKSCYFYISNALYRSVMLA